MSCNHKFKEYLSLNKLDFEPTTLIIGTFNPELPEGNYAEWFYGRTKENYFWDVLPKIYMENSLIKSKPTEWKCFCRKHKIAITDLIASINDAELNNPMHLKKLSNYSDTGMVKNFSDFDTEHISHIFNGKNSIKNVYFTRKGNGQFYGKEWEKVKKLCSDRKIEKIEELLTPSRFSGFQFGRARNRNLTKAKNTAEYILEIWKTKWHEI